MIGGPAKYGDFVGYKTVCGHLNSKWKRIWLEDQQVPFIFQGNVMVGYDDIESIAIKVNILCLCFYITFRKIVPGLIVQQGVRFYPQHRTVP
jgi:hypothetical protein